MTDEKITSRPAYIAHDDEINYTHTWLRVFLVHHPPNENQASSGMLNTVCVMRTEGIKRENRSKQSDSSHEHTVYTQHCTHSRLEGQRQLMILFR